MASIGATFRSTDVAAAEPALYGILSPAVQVVEDAEPHWVNGFDFETIECSTDVDVAPICTAGDPVRVIDASVDTLYKTFYPFSVQTSFTCSTMSRKPAELEELARRALELCQQKAIEHELWTGALAKSEDVDFTGTYPNRYLASTDAVDITPTPSTPVKSKHGLALLEKALGDCGCGARGTIHATRDVASALAAKNDEGYLMTTLGNKIVAGSGYTGSGPDGTLPTGTQMWMYATGPVTVRLGPIEVIPGDIGQSVNLANNESTYYAERAAAATWSACCHYAVLVDLSLDYA